MKGLLLKTVIYVSIITGMLIITAHRADCQVDTLKNPAQYLYSEFTRARIATKVGKDLTMLANYNIITERIVFLQKGQIYDLIDYHNVDTIYFKDVTYIPGVTVFYELAVSGPASLLIRHWGTIQDPPKPAAYGGTSEVSSSSYINNINFGNVVYRLKKDTALIIRSEDEYLFKKGEVISPFRTEKQFLALFPEISNELKSFIKENKIHFDRKADLAKLVKYCNSLKN